jgi:hypothetical protein
MTDDPAGSLLDLKTAHTARAEDAHPLLLSLRVEVQNPTMGV